jgi:dolichol-phosphate mannosyltransferase
MRFLFWDLATYATPVRTCVVTPTFNEAENIDEFLREVRGALPDAHILVVDDSSPDGTAELVERMKQDLNEITVLSRPQKSGLGSAYRDGFKWAIDAGYELVVEMDADLSHQPSALPKMVAAAEPAALVIGSRYVSGGQIPAWPWYRLALSKWGNRYAGWVLGNHLRDATSGYRIWKAKTLEAIDVGSTRADGYGFQIEMAYRVSRMGGQIVEFPITFVDRTRGKSKMSGTIVVEALLLVTWWAFRDRVFRRFNAKD